MRQQGFEYPSGALRNGQVISREFLHFRPTIFFLHETAKELHAIRLLAQELNEQVYPITEFVNEDEIDTIGIDATILQNMRQPMCKHDENITDITSQNY